MIQISPNLERRIIQFANKYRQEKYKIDVNSEYYNKHNNSTTSLRLLNFLTCIFILSYLNDILFY